MLPSICRTLLGNPTIALPHAGSLGAWRAFSALPQLAHSPQPSPRSRLAGQPTPETHPDVLGPEELAPGITAAEFEARRRALARAMPPASIAVLPAAGAAYVTGVIPYPYRQDADFMYMTGIQQQAVAVIETPRQTLGAEHRYVLFVPQPDSSVEQWDGAWLGAQAARDVFGGDEVYPLHELPTRLQRMASGASSVLFDYDRCPRAVYGQHLHAALHEAASRGKTGELRKLVHRLRLRKSPAELRLLRASAQAAAGAITQCMRVSHPGVRESTLAATFDYHCRLAGAQRLAYPPVVGGGVDACTIHYSRNDKPVAGHELVLMDAGCELWGYCSDVTRTWPVGGRFVGAQRDLYAAVLEVRGKCLEAVRPGTSVRKLHQLAVLLLSDAIRQLGLVRGASVDAIAAGPYREFFVHSIAHHLGLDVHDTNTAGPERTLDPGAALAVEPGLYVPDDPRYGPFRGLGVRLEDDVAVTQRGCEVLSAGVPVEMEAIEALVGTVPLPDQLAAVASIRHSAAGPPLRRGGLQPEVCMEGSDGAAAQTGTASSAAAQAAADSGSSKGA